MPDPFTVSGCVAGCGIRVLLFYDLVIFEVQKSQPKCVFSVIVADVQATVKMTYNITG